MQAVGKLDRICNYIAKATSWLCTSCLAGSILVMLLQVFLRRIFNRPLIWAEDLTVFVFIWITFLGAAVLYQRKTMTSVNSLVVCFPPALRWLAGIFSDGAVVACSVFMIKTTLDYMAKQMKLGHKLGGSLGIPIWVVLIAVILSMTMILLFGLISIYKRVHGLHTGIFNLERQKENDV